MFERLMEVITWYGALMLVFVAMAMFNKSPEFKPDRFIYAQARIWLLIAGVPGVFYVLFGEQIFR